MGSKKKKQVKQKETPTKSKVASSKKVITEKNPINSKDPESYYKSQPSWNFNTTDKESWAFTEDCVGDVFWSEILPKLESFEKQKWNDILVVAKKQNHSIDVENLNKIAQDRLTERRIEAGSLISLRLSGKHRIYGYMTGSVFNVLWYDNDHGNNDTCVCKSNLKHT